jgi:FAD/FMN-containing dehydrogenase
LTTLSKAFKGDLVTPSDPDYAAAIARWATNANRNAKVVAFVKDSEDVALSLKFSQDNKLPLAIKGGGHSTSGASSSEGGIVIDLSRHVNSVRVDTENKLAYVGGGAVWADVDKAAIEHGLAGVAGTINHTGVGGSVKETMLIMILMSTLFRLTLGGGLGWLRFLLFMWHLDYANVSVQ